MEKMKTKQKVYADKHRRAKTKEIHPGDKVLIKQNKATLKPPYDPTPYEVTQVKGTQIIARRGKGERTRNVDKVKLVRKRPDYLRPQTGRRKPTQDSSDSEDDYSWRCTRARQDPPPPMPPLPPAQGPPPPALPPRRQPPPPPPPRHLREQWTVNEELQARTVRVIVAHTSQQHTAAEHTTGSGRKTKQPELYGKE